MNVQQLLESSNQFKQVSDDAKRLSDKWVNSGLLEGISNKIDQNTMSMLLENQAKQLITEGNVTGGTASMSGGGYNSENWAGVALPLVRRVFGQIAAKEFVSVQPMNLPSGLVFYLDFQYGTTKAPFTAGQSLYGTQTAAEQPFGNTNSGGLYGAGRFGYSVNNTASNATATTASAGWSDLLFDSDYSASAVAGGYKTVSVPTSSLANLDIESVRAFTLTTGSISGAINLPQFTKIVGGNAVFVVSGSQAPVQSSTVAVAFQLQPTDRYRGDFEDANPSLNSLNSASISIPEINVQMKSSAIVAKTRKLKAVWTPEFAQDLNAYHALDAEAELTSILSEYISLEIDLEILDMLIDSAAAGTEVWSAVNNQAIVDNGSNGTISNLGFYNSQGQWFQTLGTKIQKLSNIIHQKTLRGGANFMVLSPSVSTIIESIPGFAGDVDGDVEKSTYAFGVQKIGALGGGKIKVYKNPYMLENQILLGFRGAQFLETGAVFAPYIPLIMTPLVYDPDTFTPRKGLLTRYAKKMVRPEFYGLIRVNGLNTL